MEQTKIGFWANLGKSFKQMFLKFWLFLKTQLHPLVMMQLKDKLNFSIFKSKKKTAFKIIWVIVGMAVVTAIIFLLFKLTVLFHVFSFVKVFNFRAFLILMTIVLVLSFVSCLSNITQTLYFAKDNPVLLTMPVKNSTIFMSKIIVCYVYELVKNCSFMLPMLVAYGLVMNLPFVFYLWIIFIVMFITLFMVILSGLLSIPAMFVAIALKKHRVLEFIVLALIAGGLAFGIVKLILAIPTDIDLVRDWGRIFWQIQDFLAGFATVFAPFAWLLQFMCGTSYFSSTFTPISLQNFAVFGVLVGAIILSLVLIHFLAKPLFLKMASTPFEYKRKTNFKNKQNFKKATFFSVVWQETKQIFRTPNTFYGILTVAILMPILVLLQNQIFSAMDIRLAGKIMVVAFNVLIILLLMFSSSSNFASLFSREGNSGYLTKTLPVNPTKVLLAKPVFQVVIFSASILASVCIIKAYSTLSSGQATLLFFALLFAYVAHVCWSLEFDLMNPQNRLYQTTGKQLKNPNESKSIILGFVVAGLFAFVTYFLMNENSNTVFLKIFFIGLVFALVRIFFLTKRIKLYYKEK